MEIQTTTPPVDQRDEAFQHLRNMITEAPITEEYRIKIIDALIAYIQTLKP
jgi:hypothetical protein